MFYLDLLDYFNPSDFALESMDMEELFLNYEGEQLTFLYFLQNTAQIFQITEEQIDYWHRDETSVQQIGEEIFDMTPQLLNISWVDSHTVKYLTSYSAQPLTLDLGRHWTLVNNGTRAKTWVARDDLHHRLKRNILLEPPLNKLLNLYSLEFVASTFPCPYSSSSSLSETWALQTYLSREKAYAY